MRNLSSLFLAALFCSSIVVADHHRPSDRDKTSDAGKTIPENMNLAGPQSGSNDETGIPDDMAKRDNEEMKRDKTVLDRDRTEAERKAE